MNEPVAVVTGGASGIGAAVCTALAAAGHSVLCLDLLGGEDTDRLRYLRVDLADAAATTQTAAAIAARHRIRALVHCAGEIRPAPLEAVRPEDLAHLGALHLAAPVLLVQAFLEGMRAARHGRIVLVSSRAALGLPTRTAYSATKAGLVGMTRTWALELAADGITVNAVAPGPIAGTAMFHALVPEGGEAMAALARSIPVGRLGAPEDVAHAVRFFVAPESGFVTGQVLYVCGGASVGSMPL
jgi:NAD(P)-dependent dehydrogenase (short-subunit alcohol dehydrogenase family)